MKGEFLVVPLTAGSVEGCLGSCSCYEGYMLITFNIVQHRDELEVQHRDELGLPEVLNKLSHSGQGVAVKL